MCGLTGFLNTKLNGDLEPIITKMTNCLIHRGPDEGAVWLDTQDAIALGHRRLAILDRSSAGRQPMHSHSDRYVIVYNGELYNYPTIKKQLQQKGHQFIGRSDTEVLLTSIEEYGIEHTLHTISGMFAFALWDKKEKNLTLARDRLGEKPLYYGLINDTLVFGSELKAILAYPMMQKNISRNSVELLMRYGYIPQPNSIYDNIVKLPPGTYITLQKNKLTLLPAPKEYWSALQVAQNGISNPLLIKDSEAIEQTDNLLNTIIKTRMISDVPIGTFLSGGVDSSLIAALMQANSENPIKTFTIGFSDKQYNEAEYAKAIAQHLGTDHTEFYVEPSDALAVIPKLATIYDEPFADSSAIPTFLVSQLTKQQVSVCLSGDGGDELFGGYNRYLLAKNLWNKMAIMPYPIRLIAKKVLLSVSPTRWNQVLQFINLSMIGDKLHKFAESMTAKSPELLYQHLISQWPQPEKIILSSSKNYSQNPILLAVEEMDFIEKMMITDSISYLPDDIMTKVDRAGMAVSLESRAPYLDHQLFEFIWQLPLHMKIRNRNNKWLLRQVLSRYIPNQFFERPKMGFGVPLAEWLRGPLRDWAETLLNKKLMEQQGFFQTKPILDKWQEHLSGKRNWQYQLWTVLMFQAWMSQ